jgi:hypothetical protein
MGKAEFSGGGCGNAIEVIECEARQIQYGEREQRFLHFNHQRTLFDFSRWIDTDFNWRHIAGVGFDCSRPAYSRHTAQALLFVRSPDRGLLAMP